MPYIAPFRPSLAVFTPHSTKPSWPSPIFSRKEPSEQTLLAIGCNQDGRMSREPALLEHSAAASQGPSFVRQLQSEDSQKGLNINESVSSGINVSNKSMLDTMLRDLPVFKRDLGQLLTPALRPNPIRRKHSSNSSVPKVFKVVRFDSRLEIKIFCQVDSPSAVTATSPPVEIHPESEFLIRDKNQTPSFEWEAMSKNFTTEPTLLSIPVRLENVFMSPKSKKLVGVIAVENLAYEKLVIVRYTIDHWTTISEVAAEFFAPDFNSNPNPSKYSDEYNHFKFTIDLAGHAQLETDTFMFCVKYCVKDQEYWSNNDSANFQVNFRMKPRQLERSDRNISRLPTGPDKQKSNSNKSIFQIISEKSRVISAASEEYTKDLYTRDLYMLQAPIEKPPRFAPSPSRQSFGKRYNFDASLSTALEHTSRLDASNKLSRMKSNTNNPNDRRPPDSAERPVPASACYIELLEKFCFFSSTVRVPQLTDRSLCLAT